MRVLAIANQKGGVGKTTTAVTLAHDLARKGHTTVLVDLDAQGNAAACLGLSPAPGLYKLLLGLTPLDELLTEARPGLWFLASDASTAKVKMALAAEPYRESILAKALTPLEADFCLLDCGPSRDLLHDLAHHAAGEVVIPTACDHLSLAGVKQELDSLQLVQEHGHKVACLAVLPTFYDTVTTESQTNLRRLVDAFGPLVLPAIPRATRLREAPAAGLTLWEYLSDGHPACKAYGFLTERVLEGAAHGK